MLTIAVWDLGPNALPDIMWVLRGLDVMCLASALHTNLTLLL